MNEAYSESKVLFLLNNISWDFFVFEIFLNWTFFIYTIETLFYNYD